MLWRLGKSIQDDNTVGIFRQSFEQCRFRSVEGYLALPFPAIDPTPATPYNAPVPFPGRGGRGRAAAWRGGVAPVLRRAGSSGSIK